MPDTTPRDDDVDAWAAELLAGELPHLERLERVELTRNGLLLAVAERLCKIAAELAHHAGEHRVEQLAGCASLALGGRARAVAARLTAPRPHGGSRG